jgi:lipoate-protein ligase A
MNVQRYKNGTVKESGTMMLKPLFEVLETNMKKKIRTFTDDNFISILSESAEWGNLNEQNDRKISIKDVLKTKLNGQKVSTKLQEIDLELESIVPKLISVLMETFSDLDFAR